MHGEKAVWSCCTGTESTLQLRVAQQGILINIGVLLAHGSSSRAFFVMDLLKAGSPGDAVAHLIVK